MKGFMVDMLLRIVLQIKSVFTRITPKRINRIVMIFGEKLCNVIFNSFLI